MKLDTEMEVSEHASEQAPTKLGLKPGQTIKVEDAIKGLVTRSANDASVVIAEAIAGDEDEFAKLMTRKARALGMSRTVYRNASGLPNDEQVTTARDQATLGRAIQDRFPRYYRYFATTAFNYRGQSIRNHNRLLGNVEGVDGIKTGYTRASGFNLVTSMRRGNRHLVGVVLGGRSGGSRDAIMRNLLAENLDKGATTRTVAAITERNSARGQRRSGRSRDQPRPTRRFRSTAPAAASPSPASAAMQPRRARCPGQALADGRRRGRPAAAASQARTGQVRGAGQARTRAADQRRDPDPADAAIPGSAEPMKPVRVKTVQVKAGPMKLASAGPSQPAPPVTNAIAPARPEVAETSSAVVAKADIAKPEATRPEVGPGRTAAAAGQSRHRQRRARRVAGLQRAGRRLRRRRSAYADPAPRAQPQAVQQNGAIKPAAAVAHTGWIIQVGALETESEARAAHRSARNQARGLLSKADPFTEPVVAKDNRKLFRARFAGLERDQAEAVCRTLKRADISCITVRN